MSRLLISTLLLLVALGGCAPPRIKQVTFWITIRVDGVEILDKSRDVPVGTFYVTCIVDLPSNDPQPYCSPAGPNSRVSASVKQVGIPEEDQP